MKTTQPRKQRKRLYNMPIHQRHKLINVGLSENLRKKFNRRNMAIRKGDKVEVMRGEFKGTKSIVNKVDLRNLKIILDEVKRSKTDGTEVRIPVHPSNLRLIEPDMTDKKRQKVVKRVKGEFEVKKPKPKKKKEKKEVKKKDEGIKCPVCGKKFENKKDLNTHVEKDHKQFRKGE